MAEEEVVILEADGATSNEEGFAPIEEENSEEGTSLEIVAFDEGATQTKKKKLLLLLLAGGILLLAIIVAIIVIIKLKSHPEAPPAVVAKVEEAPIKEQFSPSRLDGMIKKAHLLYEQGNKDEALKIYEKNRNL